MGSKKYINSNLIITKYRDIYNESIDFFYINFNVYDLSFNDFEKMVSGFFYHAISSLLVMPNDFVKRSQFENDLIFIPSDLYLKSSDNNFRKVLIENGLIVDERYPISSYTESLKDIIKKSLVSYSRFKSIIIHDTSMLSFSKVIKSGLGYLPNLTRLFYRPKIKIKNRNQFNSDNNYIDALIELYPICFFEDSNNFVNSIKKLPVNSNYFQGIGYFLDPLFFFTIIRNQSKIIGLAHGGSYDIFTDDIPTEIEKKLNNKFFSWISESSRLVPLRFIENINKINLSKAKIDKILWIGSSNVTSKNIYSFRLSENAYNENILKIYNFLTENRYDFCYKSHPIGLPDCLKKMNIQLSSDPIHDLHRYKLLILDMPDATLLWYCISNNINFVVFYSSNFTKFFSSDFKNYINIKDSMFINSDNLLNVNLNSIDNKNVFAPLYGFTSISNFDIRSYFNSLSTL